jgi:hypothetical protein
MTSRGGAFSLVDGRVVETGANHLASAHLTAKKRTPSQTPVFDSLSSC